MPDPVIEVRGLSKSYCGRPAVDTIDLAVPAGARYGFLGPNGAGKTTTIRMLLGLLRPSAGHARVLGGDPWSDGPRLRADVGYVPGDLRLYSWWTPVAALRLFGAIRGRDLEAEGSELLERFGLDRDVRVRTMSRGMRQKLGLVLALAPRPRLLILDEPTSGLDPLMQQLLLATLRELNDNGTTVFFSSHRLGDVGELCDRVAIIRRGRIVADEALETLRKRAGHEIAIRFDADVSDAPPPFLTIDRRGPREWHGTLTGDVRELVAWLGTRPLEELSLQRPELDDLFRRYYQGDG